MKVPVFTVVMTGLMLFLALEYSITEVGNDNKPVAGKDEVVVVKEDSFYDLSTKSVVKDVVILRLQNKCELHEISWDKGVGSYGRYMLCPNTDSVSLITRSGKDVAVITTIKAEGL